MKRADFIGGINPVCASSYGDSGSCGAGKVPCGGACGAPSAMTNNIDIPIVFMNNANAILRAAGKGRQIIIY